LPIVQHGTAGQTMWAASHDVRGQTLAEWMIHHGRFPPAAVCDIARQMLRGLLACEQIDLVHGDLRASQVLLDARGKIWLPGPGLRPAVRPEEGFGYAELPPDAYDGLAPERVAIGRGADTAADVHACGCLWWQLLAGRPAVAGGTALAKLRAAQTAKIQDIRLVAPDVAPALAEAIAACIQRAPGLRPPSIAAIAERLGAQPSFSSRVARRALVASARRWSSSFRRPSTIAAATGRASRNATRVAIASTAIAAAVVGAWPHWDLGRHWRAGAADAGAASEPPARVQGPGGEPARIDVAASQALAQRADAGAADVSESATNVVRASWSGPARNVLELETSQPHQLSELPLADGQTVRGNAGKRPLVVVPASGLVVDAEDVRFENVDFVGRRSGAASQSRAPALIRLQALKAAFAGCSFQSSGVGKPLADRLPAAIHWIGKPASAEAELGLPTGELSFDRCVFSRISAAVHCDAEAALVFDLTEVLHLGPGPLIVLEGIPQADEPISLAMSHLTLRGAAGLLECRYAELAEEAGRLAIQASECAFVPTAGSGLFQFKGAARPIALLERLDWSGQGSVLAFDAPLALWDSGGGRILAASDESIQVAGLVRTNVGFAGDADAGPLASRIVRWQVPLRSTDPPGIGDGALALPKVDRP
ncbi:MAG TPA: protein kinase, partial [Pirellulales bacterium]|nr:protein kinase [Pirellulales bacterium]